MHRQKIAFFTLVTFLIILTPHKSRAEETVLSLTTFLETFTQTSNSRQAEAEQLIEQGNQNYGNDYPAAFNFFQQALTIYQQLQDRKGQIQTLLKMGKVQDLGGVPKQAIPIYKQVFTLSEQIPDLKERVEVLETLGKTQYNFHPEGAAQTFQAVLSLYRQLGNPEGEKETIELLKDIADRLESFGIGRIDGLQFEAALNSWEQGLKIAQEFKDREKEGLLLRRLGKAYLDFGEYRKALEYLNPALAIAKEKSPKSVSDLFVLEYLGDAYLYLREYEQALSYYQQSFDSVKNFKDQGLAASNLANIGNVYLAKKDYNKAIELYQQSLALRPDNSAFTGLSVAPLAGLANAYEDLGENDKALDYYQQSLREADFKARASIFSDIGRFLLHSGNLPEAEQALRKSMNTWEIIRSGLGNQDTLKVSIFEKQSRTYRTLQQVLIAQNKTDEALEIAERGRARAFIDLLSKKIPSYPTNECKLNGLTVLCEPKNLPNLEQIKQIAQQQKATLVEYSIIYDDSGKQSELFIWVVQPSGTINFRRVDLKSLNTLLKDLVANSRAAIGVRGRGLNVEERNNIPSPQTFSQLYQILIQPITDLLPKDSNSRVIFIPQDSLFLVPFAALQNTNGKYLIEQHTILAVPSIQVLDLTRKQRQQLSSQTSSSSEKIALVVGNPTMPSIPFAPGEAPQQLPSLPGAELEAKAIAQLLKTQAIIGGQATKFTILQQLPKARLIHLATHGLLDDFRGSGVPGAIALAPFGSDDGLLTASEILDLKLNAELVVLSACDTGKGRITGDGVIGLSRSLFSAGVPSVIVSLWAVSDAPTASLMTEFYRNLQQHPDKAKALRSAMLTTMKQYPNPRNWAAFTLIGEAE